MVRRSSNVKAWPRAAEDNARWPWRFADRPEHAPRDSRGTGEHANSFRRRTFGVGRRVLVSRPVRPLDRIPDHPLVHATCARECLCHGPFARWAADPIARASARRRPLARARLRLSARPLTHCAPEGSLPAHRTPACVRVRLRGQPPGTVMREATFNGEAH